MLCAHGAYNACNSHTTHMPLVWTQYDMLLTTLLNTIPNLKGYQNFPCAPVNLTSSLPFLYKYQLEMELLYQANPADNYVSLHLQSGFVAGAVGGEGRGSEVDYH